MLKGIVSIIVFGLIAIIIVALLIIRFMYKGVKFAREAQERFEETGGKRFNRQEYIRYEKQKREKTRFGNDYFKSSDDAKREQEEKEAAAKKTTARRQTTTSSGVTIIDDRDSEEKRKIFDHSDGEYVEFEEV